MGHCYSYPEDKENCYPRIADNLCVQDIYNLDAIDKLELVEDGLSSEVSKKDDRNRKFDNLFNSYVYTINFTNVARNAIDKAVDFVNGRVINFLNYEEKEN